MIAAHTVEQVRAAEAALMDRLPEGQLMQRASFGLATVCARILGGPYGARVVLLVGGGNNGGDALWAGARLASRGAHVDVVLLRPERAHTGGLAALRAGGGRVLDHSGATAAIQQADLVVDGIYGIGGRPGLDDPAASLVQEATASAGLVVAVDVPSGIDPDTGEVGGPAVHADLTVTFGTHKIGLLVDPGAEMAGRVEFVDIGLAPDLPTPDVTALERADVAALLPRPSHNSDKYQRGVVGIRAGSPQYQGAAVLAVGGALSAGAGMVRYVGTDAVASGVRAHWPEVIVSPDAASTGRVQAWVVGPGLGDDKIDEQIFASGLPMLVDADGLRSLPATFDAPALLTPHAGELARMLDVDRADVEASRLEFARRAAERWNATVLLKGSTTVIAAPDGRTRVNLTGTPALATAGSGDVLAGLAGALLAAGCGPLDAGSVAAHLHGLAGQAARGQPSANGILRALPVVIASLGG